MLWSQHSAHWPNAEHSRHLTVGRQLWHVQVTEEVGPCVLLLHGTGASTHSWAGLLTHLAKNHQVVAPDLPGHGFTGPLAGRAPTIENFAQAVEELIYALALSKPITQIVGHSAGAVVGMQLRAAGSVPELKSLAGINPAFYPFDGPAASLFPAIAKLLFVNPFVPRLVSLTNNRNRTSQLIDSTGSVLTEQQRDFYAQLVGDRAHVEGALAMMAHWDLAGFQSTFEAFDLPFLQLIGAKDGTIPSEKARIAERVLGAMSCKTLRREDAGHLLHEEHPIWTAEALKAFWSELN